MSSRTSLELEDPRGLLHDFQLGASLFGEVANLHFLEVGPKRKEKLAEGFLPIPEKVPIAFLMTAHTTGSTRPGYSIVRQLMTVQASHPCLGHDVRRNRKPG